MGEMGDNEMNDSAVIMEGVTAIQTGETRHVYLLVTPLQCYHRYNLQRVDYSRKRCPNNRVPFRRLQHWAIQVGDDHDGEMYEVTSYYNKRGQPELNMITADKWRETRRKHLHFAQKMFITVTQLSSQSLKNIAEALWEVVLQDQYRAMSRNCQSFAELFKAIIQSHHLLSDEDHMEVQGVPHSFNPFFVFMHLTQAKSVAARWTRIILRKEPSAGSHDKIPGKRSGRYLELINEAAKNHDFHSTADVRAIIQEANHLRRSELKPGYHPPPRSESTKPGPIPPRAESAEF